MSVNACEREEEEKKKRDLMQFEYCRQLLSKTNDKYYLRYVLYICVLFDG